MNAYKIIVNSEAESKEAQELFFELGYEWRDSKRDITNLDVVFIYAKDGVLTAGFNDHNFAEAGHKELTLPQLRDLVVLKRNDINDANCIDKKREAWYLASDGTYYAWQYRKLCWDTESDACVEAHDIKPINQPQDPALISGAEAKLAWAKGIDIQIKNVNCVNWYDLDESKYNLDIFDHVRVVFRLKPRTIKLNGVEVPAPDTDKITEDDICWHITGAYECGYANHKFDPDHPYILGVWSTEEKIKQVVSALKQVIHTKP